MFRFYFWTAAVASWLYCMIQYQRLMLIFFFPVTNMRGGFPQTSTPTSHCTLLLLLQTCSGGLSVYQRLLYHRGWILPAQELHLHFLTNGGQVSGEITERQALMNRVAVRSGGRVPNHLVRAHKCVNFGVANNDFTTPGISLICCDASCILPFHCARWSHCPQGPRCPFPRWDTLISSLVHEPWCPAVPSFQWNLQAGTNTHTHTFNSLNVFLTRASIKKYM